MWEALGNSIKAFIEKDLVPSIISLAAGIITVLILPEDNWMVEKVGTVWIGVLAFALGPQGSAFLPPLGSSPARRRRTFSEEVLGEARRGI